jgi:hypothetical protein
MIATFGKTETAMESVARQWDILFCMRANRFKNACRWSRDAPPHGFLAVPEPKAADPDSLPKRTMTRKQV